MKKLVLIFLLLPICIFAQNDFWSNNGAFVSIKDKAYLSVVGDMHNLRGGLYDNTDSIFLTGDWRNDAGNHAFTGIDSGYVFFYAADQTIKGRDETYFHNLVLKNQGVKYAVLDAKVDGVLDMTDREFSVDTNTIWVRNADYGAVKRTTGFLSSWKDGGLLRYTNSTNTYLFPVGSNYITSRYRPVEITPVTNDSNIYKARFANVDPSTEGFSRNNRFHLVCEVNPNWYHRLYHPQGNDSAEIAIFYDATSDGNWDDIVHWQRIPQWEAIFRDTILAGSPFNRISKTKWNNFRFSPFALAVTSPPFAVAGVDTIIWKYDTIQLHGSGGSAFTWRQPYNMICPNCPDPLVYPEKDYIYYLTVWDDKGCVDYDSLRIFVRDKPLVKFFIPDVITPNGDGYNDYWHIRDLERYTDNSVQIINRWGDEVFYEKPYSQSWVGHYKGEPLPDGTYYYIIYVKDNEGKEVRFDGPLTIVK